MWTTDKPITVNQLLMHIKEMTMATNAQELFDAAVPDMTATQATSPDTNEEFDMPAEFADDPTLPPAHSGSTSTVQSMSDADFDQQSFNDDQDELERAKLNPPVGDWKKDTSWEYSKQVIVDDQQQGDFDPTGRTFLVFAGKPVAREANGLQYEPALRLRISPDKRYKADKPTEVDTAYKLFLKAKDVFLEAKGQKPKNMAELRNMLQHDAYIIRTMNGDNGAIVVDVKLKSFGQGNKR